MEAKKDARITQLVLSVDPSVVLSVEKVNCKPYLGLRRILMKILLEPKLLARAVEEQLLQVFY